MAKNKRLFFLATCIFLFAVDPLLAKSDWHAYCRCVNKHDDYKGSVSVKCHWDKISVENSEIARMCNDTFKSCDGHCKVEDALGMAMCSPCGPT